MTQALFGNLVRVGTADGHQLDYFIDGQNRRVGYKLDGIVQRQWLYRDGLNPVAELDRGGNLVTRYVYATQGHVPDLLLQASHGYRIVTDYLGSVRAVVDTASGAVAQRIDYDPWGMRTTDSVPYFQALGFAGGLTDSATALVRFGARDYEPAAARWTTKDPAEFDGGLNLYAYALNAPINYIDPSGLEASTGPGGRGYGAHHYKCNQVLQLMQWAREDASGPYGWFLGIRNHALPGYLDFVDREGGARFDVPGFDLPLSPEAFGNFIAGYAGYYQGRLSGLENVHIGGQIFDIFNDWPGPFSNDAESEPYILSGYMYAMKEGRNAQCGCP